MTEHARQLLHVVIALGMLAVITIGICPHTTAEPADSARRGRDPHGHRGEADPRANAVDLAPSKPTRRPRG
ncbi:hypothetical protein ABTX82_31635 [Streptomyces lavendulae]|uniref:hypothetical protein n=1 Tax=Streptomyces lavendulae TaxID=1914 RepID=UPI003330EF76